MIVISAAGSNGRSVLPSLQGASPAPSGLVTSDPAPRTRLAPGHLVRHNGGWAVIAGIRHDGIHGITTAGLIGADASPRQLVLYGPQSAEIRTDAEIDPGTLHMLVRYATRKLCDDCYQLVTNLLAECQDYCSLSLDHAGLCDPRREVDEPCDRCGRTGDRLTEHEPQGDEEAAACQPVISTTVAGSAAPGATAPSGTAYVLDVASLAAALAALSLAAPGVSDAASAAALLRLLSRSKAHCHCCTNNECECGGTALAGGA